MTVGDLLDIAIQHEMRAQILYRHLATIVSREEARDVLLELVLEERSHEGRLYQLKMSDRFNLDALIDTPEIGNDISSSHSVYVTLDAQAPIRNVVELAISREKRAQLLFHRLAAGVAAGEVRDLFLQFAEEEEEHERRILERFSPLLEDEAGTP